MMLETFPTLLRDPAHWEFELFLILIFDVLIGALAWPFIKRHIHKDVDDVSAGIAQVEAHEHEQIDELKQRIAVLEGDEAAIIREVAEGRKSPNWARERLGYMAIPSRPPWMTEAEYQAEREEFDRQYMGRFTVPLAWRESERCHACGRAITQGNPLQFYVGGMVGGCATCFEEPA